MLSMRGPTPGDISDSGTKDEDVLDPSSMNAIFSPTDPRELSLDRPLAPEDKRREAADASPEGLDKSEVPPTDRLAAVT